MDSEDRWTKEVRDSEPDIPGRLGKIVRSQGSGGKDALLHCQDVSGWRAC